MNISENVAYLKGLAEGMELSKTSNEGKMLLAMLEVLADVSDSIDSIEFDLDVVSAEISEIDDEIGALYEDQDQCGCEYNHGDYDDYEGEIYETTCPKCCENILLDEESLDDGEIFCFNCGEKLEIDFSGIFDEDDNLNLD